MTSLVPGFKVLRRADTAGVPEDTQLLKPRYGFGISWEDGRTNIDVDLQCVVVNKDGIIIDACYYNNMKAQRGITHSGDEASGKPAGIRECVWVNLQKLPGNVAVLVFVVAAYSGGYLKDVVNGKFSVMEGTEKAVVAQYDLERTNAHVDVVAALYFGSGGWMLRIIEEPAQQGQHFMDILPLIGKVVQIFLPHAPAKQKVAFAMEKGGVLDLPTSLDQITVGLGWDVDQGKVDLDVSAVLFDRSNKASEPVYYGRLQSTNGCIVHSGDNLTGEGEGDDEQIRVQLSRIPPQTTQVFFVVNIYTPGKTFQRVSNPYCRVVDDSTGSELCRYSLRESAGTANGLIISKIAREAGGRWGFHALGIPCTGRTFKDSLPALEKACKVVTAALRPQGSYTSLEGLAAAPVVQRPGGQQGGDQCCSIS